MKNGWDGEEKEKMGKHLCSKTIANLTKTYDRKLPLHVTLGRNLASEQQRKYTRAHSGVIRPIFRTALWRQVLVSVTHRPLRQHLSVSRSVICPANMQTHLHLEYLPTVQNKLLNKLIPKGNQIEEYYIAGLTYAMLACVCVCGRSQLA